MTALLAFCLAFIALLGVIVICLLLQSKNYQECYLKYRRAYNETSDRYTRLLSEYGDQTDELLDIEKENRKLKKVLRMTPSNQSADPKLRDRAIKLANMAFSQNNANEAGVAQRKLIDLLQKEL